MLQLFLRGIHWNFVSGNHLHFGICLKTCLWNPGRYRHKIVRLASAQFGLVMFECRKWESFHTKLVELFVKASIKFACWYLKWQRCLNCLGINMIVLFMTYCWISGGCDPWPWTVLHARHQALANTYNSLVLAFSSKNRLDLKENSWGNFESSSRIFSLQQSPRSNWSTRGYYVLQGLCRDRVMDKDKDVIRALKLEVRVSLGDKYFSSIKAFHWVAAFLDPTFKIFSFTLETHSWVAIQGRSAK